MPAGYRAGIPQQPYSKYESDNDEIKVEYKRVDSMQSIAWFGGYKGFVLRILIAVIIFMLGLILGYIIRRTVKELPDQHQQSCDGLSNNYEIYSTELSKRLSGLITAGSLEHNLRNYTNEVHITGTSSNNHLRDYLRNQLQQLHLVIKEFKYNVLLSYHDWERPNTVYLLNTNGSTVYTTEYRGPPVNGDPRSADHPEITESYIAYSPNGSVEGELVYVNYGEEKDFKLLVDKGVSCKDKILVVRTGRVFLGQMVQHAESCGASAVLVYPDPGDVFDDGVQTRETFPNTRYLPGWSTQRGTLWRYGDPLTPDLPSKDGIYRVPLKEAGLPKILVQPISYDDAYRLMSHMKGPSDSEFTGGMRDNVTYRMGPGYGPPQAQWTVKVDVYNDLEQRDITDIIGIIRGREEPDRYVIIGCHFDSWTFGGVDPGTGTSILMELSKAFAKLLSQGWQPRRTIMFAHWDAGEMGQIGSFEWAEEHRQELTDRTVIYINLDDAISGNFMFDVEASPMLRELIMNASRQVGFAGLDIFESLFDLWVHRSPSENDNTLPKINYMSPDSDQAAFVYYLGIPSLWPRFTNNMLPSRPSHYPARHTAIDRFEYVKHFVDPTFSCHETLTRVVAEVVLQLSTLVQLPYDVRELAETLEQEYNGLQQDGMEEFKYWLDHLQWAIRNFSETAVLFHDNFIHLDSSSSFEKQLYNDRLTKLSHSFILPHNLSTRSQIRNVLFSPSELSSYPYSTFTGIRDAFDAFIKQSSSEDRTIARSRVEDQISSATVAVQSARRILGDDEIF